MLLVFALSLWFVNASWLYLDRSCFREFARVYTC